MTNTQKVIKYLAIGFAIILIINIFSGIFFVCNIIYNIFNPNENSVGEFKTTIIYKDIKDLDISTGATKLTIKQGEELKVDSNNKNIKIDESSSKLTITEKSNIGINNVNSEVILYIPDMEFNMVSLTPGAGSVNIEELKTNLLNLELGAGKLVINKLEVLSSAKIEAGVGEVIINNGDITNLDLDAGVGKFTLNTILKGRNDIDAGIGALNINLLDEKENYTIHAEKGIGSLKIGGEAFIHEGSYGNGPAIIDLDGGIGSINVDFK